MTIPNRDEQHGGMEAVGDISQDIKAAMRQGQNWMGTDRYGGGWVRLTPGEREALDMIAHKIARILSGADPHDSQHWEDLAGYPIAVMRSREEQQ